MRQTGKVETHSTLSCLRMRAIAVATSMDMVGTSLVGWDVGGLYHLATSRAGYVSDIVWLSPS